MSLVPRSISAVGGEAITGGDRHHHARSQGACCDETALSIDFDHGGTGSGKRHQLRHGGAGAGAHQMIEIAPDQEEEQQSDRGIEEGVLLLPDRFEKAHARSEDDPERDRHIHIHPAMPQRRGGRVKKGWPA